MAIVTLNDNLINMPIISDSLDSLADYYKVYRHDDINRDTYIDRYLPRMPTSKSYNKSDLSFDELNGFFESHKASKDSDELNELKSLLTKIDLQMKEILKACDRISFSREYSITDEMEQVMIDEEDFNKIEKCFSAIKVISEKIDEVM